MNNVNIALYYPSMEFDNTEWIKGMLLFWDGIRRIVPDSYTPSDDEEIKQFVEAGLIKSIDPKKDAAKIADDFAEKLSTLYKSAAALDWVDNTEGFTHHSKLHPEKVDSKLRALITDTEIAHLKNNWLLTSNDFARFYMLYLATATAESSNLSLITDHDEAWTTSTYYAYEGALDGILEEDSDKQIVLMMLEKFLPVNLDQIKPEKIIKFREKYREERKHFIYAINKFCMNFSNIDDVTLINDIINEFKKDVEVAVRDFKQSLETLRIESFTGLKLIAIPVGINLTSFFSPELWQHKVISNAVGLALGIIASYASYRKKKKDLSKLCDFSYIYYLEHGFEVIPHGSLNHSLQKSINEFIED